MEIPFEGTHKIGPYRLRLRFPPENASAAAVRETNPDDETAAKCFDPVAKSLVVPLPIGYQPPQHRLSDYFYATKPKVFELREFGDGETSCFVLNGGSIRRCGRDEDDEEESSDERDGASSSAKKKEKESVRRKKPVGWCGGVQNAEVLVHPVWWGWSFQHALQDVFPTLLFLEESYLSRRPNAVLHLPPFKFPTGDLILRQLMELPNPITSEVECRARKAVIFWMFSSDWPLPSYQLQPPKGIRLLSRLIRSAPPAVWESGCEDFESPKRPFCIWVSRPSSGDRSVANEDDLIERAIKPFCSRLNLQFYRFAPSSGDGRCRYSAFRNAAVTIGPHGGANFHIYWMKPGSVFVEFVYMKEQHDLHSVALSIPLRYYQIPFPEFGHHSQNMRLDVVVVQNALKTLSRELKRDDTN